MPASGSPGPSRWWIYQRERFPVLQHGLLIAAFSSCAVSYSSLLLETSWPGPGTYVTAFVTCFVFFLQLRIADEFKDAAEDARWRPYRPVPRGLVALRELGLVFALGALVQLLLALWHHPPLVFILMAAWVYLALMSVEFFARSWLKARPITYLWTHMLIMPLVDLYATATQWMPGGEKPGVGLAYFLTASFTNGIVIEVGRKLRLPGDEEEGVETYSKLWGRRAPMVWVGMLVTTAGLGVLAADRIGFALPLVGMMLPVLFLASFAAHRFRRGLVSGKRIEALSGVWTLVLYLGLGLLPRLLRG